MIEAFWHTPVGHGILVAAGVGLMAAGGLSAVGRGGNRLRQVEEEVREYRGAWHGDPALKAEVLARMVEHRQEDEIIQGSYRIHDPETASGHKGCLVGCTLPAELEDVEERWDPNRAGRPREGWHRRVESLYGIPEDVAWLLDDTFEDQDTFDEAAEFAVARIEAIPVGADLRDLARRYRGEEIDDINAALVLAELRNAPLVVTP